MAVLILVPATIMIVIWLALLTKATMEDWVTAAYAKVVDNLIEIANLELLSEERENELAGYSGVAEKVMRLLKSGSFAKKIEKLKEENRNLQSGDLSSLNMLEMPGYVILRRVGAVDRNELYKKAMKKCTELYGKKYATNKTKQILAKMTSYAMIGTAAALAVGSVAMKLSGKATGALVTVIGATVVGVLVYAIYDEVESNLKKRKSEIQRQFPNVVSKLALLVTSGMVMDRAWKETAESQNGEIYREMRLTSKELSNLVEPAAAYTNFIDRCNTKETTKLASAIIQNLSKGNSEIGLLLRGMSHEAWQERRHGAKRASEAANSKLMIPTMMLFMAILVMIMVPVGLSFSGL